MISLNQKAIVLTRKRSLLPVGHYPSGWGKSIALFRQIILYLKSDRPQPRYPKMFNADSVEWIVNDLGELGVRVHGKCIFLYKGKSKEYDGFHEDGKTPMMIRRVGKREFGESCHPLGFTGGLYTKEVSPSLIDGTTAGYEWEPMPTQAEDSKNV